MSSLLEIISKGQSLKELAYSTKNTSYGFFYQTWVALYVFMLFDCNLGIEYTSKFRSIDSNKKYQSLGNHKVREALMRIKKKVPKDFFSHKYYEDYTYDDEYDPLDYQHDNWDGYYDERYLNRLYVILDGGPDKGVKIFDDVTLIVLDKNREKIERLIFIQVKNSDKPISADVYQKGLSNFITNKLIKSIATSAHSNLKVDCVLVTNKNVSVAYKDVKEFISNAKGGFTAFSKVVLGEPDVSTFIGQNTIVLDYVKIDNIKKLLLEYYSYKYSFKSLEKTAIKLMSLYYHYLDGTYSNLSLQNKSFLASVFRHLGFTHIPYKFSKIKSGYLNVEELLKKVRGIVLNGMQLEELENELYNHIN